MKIAIDARYLNGEYSGIATYSENLLCQISEIDKENEYIVIVHANYNKSLPLGKNFQITKYPKKPLSWWTLFNLWHVVKELNADVFHSLYPLSPIFYKGKLIVTLHDLQPFTDPLFSGMRSSIMEFFYDLFYRWIYPLILQKSKWIISVSDSTKLVLSELLPKVTNKTIVIHSGKNENFSIEPDESFVQKTKEKYRIPENYFLYLGSTRPNKNIPNMLRAFSILKESTQEYEDLKFVLCVSNVDRFFSNCYEIVDRLRLKLNKDIYIYKNITEEEKKVFYINSKFFCFVTKYEGFGIPLIESQSLGIPVLSCNSGSLKEISGGAAYLVDPDDPDDIADGMREILHNQELRKQLIEGGIKNIQRFNWKTTAQKVVDMYNYLT